MQGRALDPVSPPRVLVLRAYSRGGPGPARPRACSEVFLEGNRDRPRRPAPARVVGHIVVEHITRIDDDCAPDWPSSTSPGGEHKVVLSDHADLEVTVHGTEPGEPGAAGGGNASAANRIANAIPAVCAAAPGPLSPVDIPPITGAAQLARGRPDGAIRSWACSRAGR